MSAQDFLDALLEPSRRDYARLLSIQPPGPCNNPGHQHDGDPPMRVEFAGYWLCPDDEVRLPAGGWGPVGTLTTAERERISRKSRRRR